MIALLVVAGVLAWLFVGALVVRVIGIVVGEPCSPGDLWWAIPAWPALAAFGLVFALGYALFLIARAER